MLALGRYDRVDQLRRLRGISDLAIVLLCHHWRPYTLNANMLFTFIFRGHAVDPPPLEGTIAVRL